MELKRLRTFVVVAEELSFQRAANRLNLTQPPVSLQIQNLEEELGVTLFERRGRKQIALTPEGRELLEGAREILRSVERTREKVQLQAQGTVGHLRLGYSDDYHFGFLPRLLARFQKAHPQVRLTLRQMSSYRVPERVHGDELDIGFVSFPLARLDPELQVIPLPSTPIVAVVPRDHRLGKRRNIWLRELADEPMYLVPDDLLSGFASSITRLFADAGITPHCVGVAETSQILIEIAAQGGGITLASRSSVAANHDGISVLALKDTAANVELAALVRGNTRRNPALNSFIEDLEEQASK